MKLAHDLDFIENILVLAKLKLSSLPAEKRKRDGSHLSVPQTDVMWSSGLSQASIQGRRLNE